jgi:hypothetical protein
MATATVGMKRTFSAMHDSSAERNGWSNLQPASILPDLEASLFNEHSQRQMNSGDALCMFEETLFAFQSSENVTDAFLRPLYAEQHASLLNHTNWNHSI